MCSYRYHNLRRSPRLYRLVSCIRRVRSSLSTFFGISGEYGYKPAVSQHLQYLPSTPPLHKGQMHQDTIHRLDALLHMKHKKAEQIALAGRVGNLFAGAIQMTLVNPKMKASLTG